ncbi:hypothetical protein SGLAD_v1c07700 [Spiroplasma gladiatoris]|uniref:Uncharacterized protein n=1 Tax=Spiroplasma gladiatoris TaxID=2143 RepID=A0A4V1AQC0_9MOLU|nr:hypothetical protein [Spiroplasma gladiatoris]QBQ07969.1 hypothetical protein SGLAD_v1c07700 [Spiroplasma gladiatoris]
MEDNKFEKKLTDYKPNNPNDPKMPSLKEDVKETKENIKEELVNERYLEENDFTVKNEVVKNEKQETLSNSQNEESKSDAKSIIARLKQQNEEREKRTEKEKTGSKVVMPDPNSEDRLYGRYKPDLAAINRFLRDPRTKLRDASRHARDNFTQEEIDLIVNTFTYKIVKISKKEIVIKYSKYGFELFKNHADGRYWVSTVSFEEVWNPKKFSYITFWNGNTFIGYGNKTIEECITKTKQLMASGRTGDVVWKDFVTGWSQQNNRFIAGDVPTKFTWNEYKKIIKWWDENKIWILVKQEKVKDYEDLMNETRQKKASGQKVSPLVSIQAKLLDPPRRAQGVHGYPVENPDYKGNDYSKPENKLYEIGFTFVAE